MKWVEMMDELKDRYSLVSDAELSRFIGATPNDVWQARHKNKNLSTYSRWKILDKLGFVKTRDMLFDSLSVVTSPSFAHEVKESHNRIIRESVLNLNSKEAEGFNKLLIDLARKAQELGLSKTEFSSIAEARFDDVIKTTSSE